MSEFIATMTVEVSIEAPDQASADKAAKEAFPNHICTRATSKDGHKINVDFKGGKVDSVKSLSKVKKVVKEQPDAGTEVSGIEKGQ